ncbi:MAG: hypothetical protein QXR85_00170 [Candidatus Micrarchaeaceae archaeon]
MRAQLSLEFLIYVGLAGVSLAIVGAAIPALLGKANAYASSYAAASFVNAVNTALISGNATVSAYLPMGLCNSSAKGDVLETQWGTFYFVAPLLVGDALCPSGMQATFAIETDNGTIVLRRIS